MYNILQTIHKLIKTDYSIKNLMNHECIPSVNSIYFCCFYNLKYARCFRSDKCLILLCH